MHPGAERVRPSFDGKRVQAISGEREVGFPGVVAEKTHRLLARLRLPRSELAPPDHRRQIVVPLLEDVGGDANGLATKAGDGVTAAVELWLDVLGGGAPPSLWHRGLLALAEYRTPGRVAMLRPRQGVGGLPSGPGILFPSGLG